MKKQICIISLMLCAAMIINAQESDFPKLTGPYLGQEPPGMIPKVFASGIVSSDDHIEMGCTWSPDGKEFYFGRSETKDIGSNWAIWVVLEKKGVWSEPEIAKFSGVYWDIAPFFIRGGKSMIFFRMKMKSMRYVWDRISWNRKTRHGVSPDFYTMPTAW